MYCRLHCSGCTAACPAQDVLRIVLLRMHCGLSCTRCNAGCTARGVLQVVLLGVCCGPSVADDITLQALPLYTLPTDGVTVVTVASTPHGRIFLGGANGHLYEVQYNQPSSLWRSNRCTKVWGPCLKGRGFPLRCC